MPFPHKFDEFHKAGYELDQPGVCRGCGADIIWVNTPQGKRMPINPIPDNEVVTAHFATCPMADSFRKKGWKIGPVAT